jgi:hypothetical protein
MHYKLLLYDYKKLKTRLFLSIIPFVLFLFSIIYLLPHSLNRGIFVKIALLELLTIPLYFFLLLRRIYFKETILLNTVSIISEKFGEIRMSDIKKMKFETYKGLRIRLYLKNGLIVGISPFNQFKSDASRQFNEFYVELKLKYEAIQSSNIKS